MSRYRSFCYPAVLIGMVWLLAAPWISTASPRDPNLILSQDSKLKGLLLLSSKVTLTLDPKQGLLDNLLELNRQVGVDVITLLPDRQPKASAVLTFAQTPFDQVLDRVGEAYQVRWRIVASPLGEGASILLEEKAGEDDKTQLEKFREEMAHEVTRNGWLLPRQTDSVQKSLSMAYGSRENRILRGIEERLDAATRQRLATEGIPFSQLSGELQQSVGALVEAGNRKWAYSNAEQILKLLLR